MTHIRAARRPRAFAVALLLALFLIGSAAVARAAPAGGTPAASPAEIELAERYAPVVKLPVPRRDCEDDAPFQPTDVDVLLGNEEVALRGPWDRVNIAKIAPEKADLGRGLRGYNLDFPGNSIRPECDFQEWEALLQAAGARPTTYAHFATEPGHPGKLALQYWFYYTYNDWKNNHEGDWEMIQLNFDAATPEEALGKTPVEVGYSQHSSGERARWGDEKLELVDGTHPVVYPAQGSQANFFRSELFLMGSAAEGVGCDDTSDVARTTRPAVATIPSNPAAAVAAFPWLAFDGRWGQRQRSFFDGPVGPQTGERWNTPFSFAEENWRAESFTVPASGAVGTAATDFFCAAVNGGSRVLQRFLINPVATALVASAVLVLLGWLLTRSRWRPATPLPLAQRREWGRLITSGWRMMWGRPKVFLGIGLLFVPIGLLITLVQYLIFRLFALDPLVDAVGEQNAFVSTAAVGLGLLFNLLAFSLALAATARAMVLIDQGRPVNALSAYRDEIRRLPALLPAVGLAAVILVVLGLAVVLIPVAVFFLVRWSLLGVVVGAEDRATGVRCLRRSALLVKGNWWRTASVVLVVTGLALFSGSAVGVLVLLLTGAAFDLVNLIASLVYIVVLPFAAIVVTYLYFDLQARRAGAPAPDPAPVGDGVVPAA